MTHQGEIMYLKVKDFLNILLASGYNLDDYLYVSNYLYGRNGYGYEKKYYYGRHLCRNIQVILNSKQSEYYVTNINFDIMNGEHIYISKTKKICEKINIQNNFVRIILNIEKFKHLSIAMKEFTAVE